MNNSRYQNFTLRLLNVRIQQFIHKRIATLSDSGVKINMNSQKLLLHVFDYNILTSH